MNHLHMSEAAEVSVVLHGATAVSIEAQVLAGDRPQAHNRFDAPNEVLPRPTAAVVREGAIRCTLPPASVTKLKVQMI
jgi:alpha-L-arabinofuranosidase